MEPVSILIVDDNSTNTDVLKKYMTLLGYHTICVSDGVEAVSKLKEKRPDLILLDILMPRMNGIQFLQYLKEEDLLYLIPVLVISALDDIENITKCIELGAEDYLIKPFNSALLKARIKNCLNKKRRLEKEKAIYENMIASYNHLKEIEDLKNTQMHLIIHDLNNPLSSIKGYTQFLSILAEGHNPAAKDVDFFKKIGEAVIEMETLTKSILDLSKFESNKMTLNKEIFDATELARDVYQAFMLQNEAHECGFHCDLGPLNITADRALLARVLKNILLNAEKHTPEHSNINFSVRRNDKKVLFKISDNGGGIPQIYQSKIFEKYFRVETKVNKHKYGVGLGLYFCKVSIDAMNGRIWVNSKENEGADFFIEFDETT